MGVLLLRLLEGSTERLPPLSDNSDILFRHTACEGQVLRPGLLGTTWLLCIFQLVKARMTLLMWEFSLSQVSGFCPSSLWPRSIPVASSALRLEQGNLLSQRIFFNTEPRAI